MRSFWKMLSILPQSLRYKIIRDNFSYDEVLPEGIIFKAAETTEELEAAFQIIHDGFVERQLMDENQERIRLTKWNCLPCTTTLICKAGDEVIATVSLIADSSFGLPTDQHRDLSSYREKGMRLLEVSGLAIKKNKRSRRGKLILPLCKFMHEYASQVLRGDALVISTVAQIRDFYGALFLFEPLENGKVTKFNYVNNVEAISQILDLRTACERYRKTFSGAPQGKDLHKYFFELQHPEFIMPDTPYQFAINPCFSAEQFKHFFIDRSDILNSLTQKERFFLAEYYYFPEFRDIIIGNECVPLHKRTSPRIPVRYRATVLSGENNRLRTGEVEQVALHGFSLRITDLDLKVGDKVSVIMDIGGKNRMHVQGNIVWTSKNTAGVKLQELPDNWKTMNEYAWGIIRKDLRKVA